MVNKVLNILSREFSGLHQAAFLLGTFALLSQVLALVRDRIFAHSFGASATLDVYYAAFRIPDLLFAGVASLVSVTVLIPFLVKKIEGNRNDAKKFLSDIFTSFLSFIAIISVILFFAIPWLSSILFPGFSSAQQSSLVALTRILLFSPIILGLSNLFGSVTQTFRKFFIRFKSGVLQHWNYFWCTVSLSYIWYFGSWVWSSTGSTASFFDTGACSCKGKTFAKIFAISGYECNKKSCNNISA